MAVGSWQLAVGSWQLAVGSTQLAVGGRQEAETRFCGSLWPSCFNTEGTEDLCALRVKVFLNAEDTEDQA